MTRCAKTEARAPHHERVEIDVRGCGNSFSIFENGHKIADADKYDRAWMKVAAIERQRRMRQRYCLCCTEEFTSEGPGHRMCGPCRSGRIADRPNSDASDARTDTPPVTLKAFSFQDVSGAPTRTRTADLLITNHKVNE